LIGAAALGLEEGEPAAAEEEPAEPVEDEPLVAVAVEPEPLDPVAEEPEPVAAAVDELPEEEPKEEASPRMPFWGELGLELPELFSAADL
jgi:hypothetical protein